MTLLDEYGDPVECLEASEDCKGPVEFHRIGNAERAFPRCEHHWGDRLDRYEASDLERYADSDVAPSWLDPSTIGERWDEDD